MTLYEVAVIDGDVVIVEPVTIMAETEVAAVFMVGQKNPAIVATTTPSETNIKVLVRPFV